jgi:hypothetical protein
VEPEYKMRHEHVHFTLSATYSDASQLHPNAQPACGASRGASKPKAGQGKCTSAARVINDANSPTPASLAVFNRAPRCRRKGAP